MYLIWRDLQKKDPAGESRHSVIKTDKLLSESVKTENP